MAKVIEFYIPNNFRKQIKRTPVEQRGQVIEFDSLKKNTLSDCFPQGMTAVPHGSRYIK